MKKSPVSHFLVALQFASIGVGLYPWAGQPQGSPWWLVLTGLGVLVGLYTLLHNRPGNFAIYPEPKERACLVTTGPYRWVRHPMYLAVLLFMLGIALYNGTWINAVAMVTLFLALWGKMIREERYLHRHFDGYGDYACRCKRLIPFLF